MKNKSTLSSEWKLTLQWTLSCLIGFSAGIGLSLVVPESMGEITSSILFGLVVGLAQWIVLRKRFRVSAWWILITALASTLGFAAIELIHRSLLGFRVVSVPGILGLTAQGIIVGLFQWRFLRRHYQKAGWWVLLCAGAWCGGGSIAWILRLQFLEIITLIADFAVLGFVVGLSTGLVFFFLKERQKSLEDNKLANWAAAGISLALIIFTAISDNSAQQQQTWDVLPELGSPPPCENLPAPECEGNDAHCIEIVPFEPISGPGYSNYPINDENWENQYRSYLRRDLRTLIQFAAAKVACKTADWNYSQVQLVGLGDMSEADGSIPGTSNNDPDHPWGTHQKGNDIDVGYFQISSQSFWLSMDSSGPGLEGNLLRPVCRFTRYGMNVYHCTDLPYLLDPWRTALFIAYLAEHPYLRVIGVDGQAGPVVEAALDQLVDAGWVDNALREKIPLAYEVVPEGMGWYKHHHHHLHISLFER